MHSLDRRLKSNVIEFPKKTVPLPVPGETRRMRGAAIFLSGVLLGAGLKDILNFFTL